MKTKLLAILAMILGVGIWTLIGISTFREGNQPKAREATPTEQTTSTETFGALATPPEQENPISEPLPSPTPTTKPTTTRSTQTTQPKTTNPAPASQGTGIPKTINIPKLGIQASVESVGLDSAGRMDVPKKWANVAWYNLGYKVGRSGGSAVMSGHLDTSSGAPAVFYNIEKLNPGDELFVTDVTGAKYKYRVVEKQVYPWDGLPLQRIFGSSGIDGLNLITCDGAWDRNTRNYSQRMVIYSVLSN